MSNLRLMWVKDSNGNNLEAISAAIPVLKVALADSSGALLKSLGGALNIHNADVHTEPVSRFVYQNGATSTTLAAPVAVGATQITVASAAGLAVGNMLIVGANSDETHLSTITVIAGTTITLDFPLSFAYAAGDTVQQVSNNLAVVGTLAAPQSFTLAPRVGEVYHLDTLTLEMTHTTAGDNGLFGDLTKLTNGVVLRVYNGTSGAFSIFAVWKSNSGIAVDTYEITYAARSGGGGSYGTNARWLGRDMTGAILRLDGTAGDYLEVLVQDDISALTSFRIKMQGHYEGQSI